MLTRSFTVLALALGCLLGCAHAPATQQEANRLEDHADATLVAMVQADPSLQPVLSHAAGYVVFPSVGEGGLVVGATAGTGLLYVGGNPSGYVTLHEGSVGAQVGGQSYSELIVLQDPRLIERLRSDTFELTADVSATAVTAGAAESTDFRTGTAIFIFDENGAMAEASVGAQRLDYSPLS